MWLFISRNRVVRAGTPSPVSWSSAAGRPVTSINSATGYVERVPDPTDGRTRLVRFTRRGNEVVAIANAMAVKIEAEWAAHLGPERMAHLRDALGKLREITDPFE